MGQFIYFWYHFIKKTLISFKFIDVFFKSINNWFKYLDVTCFVLALRNLLDISGGFFYNKKKTYKFVESAGQTHL